MGVDPGSVVTGYALIEYQSKRIKLLHMGIIQLGKESTEGPEKLRKIFLRLSGLMSEYKPDEFAIEAPFFGKNVQAMLKLGRAQGIAIATALHHNIPIFEYAPRKVKMSVTGKGTASKEQVSGFLASLIGQTLDDTFLDATDALAVAVCHAFQQSTDGTTSVKNSKKSNTWAQFLAHHPDKIYKK